MHTRMFAAVVLTMAFAVAVHAQQPPNAPVAQPFADTPEAQLEALIAKGMQAGALSAEDVKKALEMSAALLRPHAVAQIARAYLASAEMVKVQGYTRMRFVKGAGQVRQAASPTDSANSGESEDTDQTCGQYGCDARTWRRRMARLHKVSDKCVRLWEAVLKAAKKGVSAPMYQLWLARTLLVDLDGDSATILVPGAFYRDSISDRYESALQEALRELLRTDLTLMYRTDSK